MGLQEVIERDYDNLSNQVSELKKKEPKMYEIYLHSAEKFKGQIDYANFISTCRQVYKEKHKHSLFGRIPEDNHKVMFALYYPMKCLPNIK